MGLGDLDLRAMWHMRKADVAASGTVPAVRSRQRNTMPCRMCTIRDRHVEYRERSEETMTDGQIEKWADPAMWLAEPQKDRHPTVTLLSMTDQPLRVLAAAAELYQGRVYRD